MGISIPTLDIPFKFKAFSGSVNTINQGYIQKIFEITVIKLQDKFMVLTTSVPYNTPLTPDFQLRIDDLQLRCIIVNHHEPEDSFYINYGNNPVLITSTS